MIVENEIIIKKLPFYWRLSNPKNKIKNVVNDFYPFCFDYDYEDGLLIQKRDKKVLKALNTIYTEEYNIGYLQDGYTISKSYGADFINYLSKILKKNSSIKKILEIGCGGCVILEQIKKEKLYVCGIDSSPFAAFQGKKKNIEVITDFFPSKKITQKFDLIFHVDVLEHIDEYKNFLEAQYEQLNDNGLIVVNVPDASKSIESGDISMAMHQHLNYFTKKSLSYILNSVGFNVISVDNAGYGGSIYATAQKKFNTKKNYMTKTKDNSYKNFLIRAKKTIDNFKSTSENIINDPKRSLGYYVPLRTLPYLSFLNHNNNNYRFFDDTFHWHNCVFDGVNIPIESFSDLISRPTTDIILMSLTFEDIIKKKLQKTFGKKINITSLKKLITKVK